MTAAFGCHQLKLRSFFSPKSGVGESILLLNDISSPEDIKSLSYEELNDLASQIRKRIIEVVGSNGGHLASNLGSTALQMPLYGM